MVLCYVVNVTVGVPNKIFWVIRVSTENRIGGDKERNRCRRGSTGQSAQPVTSTGVFKCVCIFVHGEVGEGFEITGR